MRSGRGWFVCNTVAAAPFAPAQVEIYGDIGAQNVSASMLLASLGSAQAVEIRINSGGGDLFEGLTIYNRLRSLSRVSVVVDGLAASAASVVAMAASPGCLGMAPNSRMMVHEANLTGSAMTAAELSAASSLVDGLSDEIATIYARRSGRPAAHWRARMKSETWLSAHQAVAEGLADYVEGDDTEFAANLRWQVQLALRERGFRG